MVSRTLITQPPISLISCLFLSTLAPILMANTTAYTCVLSLLMFLLLHQHFDLISASRVPPSITKAYIGKPAAPSLNLDRFTINRYKKTETEAFRPTSPGHSPGVGHLDPPSGRP
ncbi:hypothetical protein V6N13_097774 [Hibiscus sabdariffa]|uniref:Uncharacterized protein n=2 Tax=Hibiscus sabdariffa TaxID=183260 RepID=A0ABR1ZM89_9ROSI